MAEYAELSPETIFCYINEYSDEYKCVNGVVIRLKPSNGGQDKGTIS